MAESSDRNNKGTAVSQGMIARASQAVRYLVSGVAPDGWFTPLQPLAPVAQEKALGRALDYDTGFNLRQKPKGSEGADFAGLRALADGYDLLRIIIETRKDQISTMPISFKPKDDKKAVGDDPRIDMLMQFFSMPDKENSWPVWLRALVEDMLIIDAATLYPRKTLGGDLYALELMDGALIKRVIDDRGRTPLPPSPAYQQVLKGLPAVDYSRDTLIYAPRNIRTNRIYGYSPVEQVQMTVNIALRRQLSQLQYYTDGSTADLIFGVPEDWQPDQVKQFQEWWDSILQGNTAARRGTRFVPGGLNSINTKDAILKDAYDEWLARIVCFAFSVSPQALVAQMNRATAETAAKQAAQEGLLPMMQWVKDLIDRVLVQHFGITDLEFAWKDDAAVDPLVQSQIDVAYVTAKIKDANEVREALGLGALTPEQEAKLNPPPPEPTALPGQSPGGSDGGGGAPGTKPLPPPTEKLDGEGAYLGKALPVTFAKARAVRAIKRDRRAVKTAHAGVVAAIEAWQKTAKASMIEQAIEQLNSRKALFTGAIPTHAEAHATKAEAVVVADEQLKLLREKALDEIRRELDTTAGITTLFGDMDDVLSKLAADGAIEALVQMGMNDAPAVTLDLVNAKAVAWAKDRAAEMVGKRLVNGELVDNANAQWVITDMQRSDTATLVVDALEAGWSNERLASRLEEDAAFGRDRAEMIARTETAMADVAGNMDAYRSSSLVTGKQWILGDEACEDCVANAEQGPIGLDDAFLSGDDAPPAHPNCRCDVLPVLVEDGPSDDASTDDGE